MTTCYGEQVIRACEAHEDRDAAIADRTDEIIWHRQSEMRNALYRNEGEARDLLIDYLVGTDNDQRAAFLQLLTDAAGLWGEVCSAEAVGARLKEMVADYIEETASEGAADIAEQELDDEGEDE